MFISRSAGERFPADGARGPELRQGLRLYRVENTTGLQVREGAKLDSRECGRIGPGEVFGVSKTAFVNLNNQRVTRLRVVQPSTGWVSGTKKWVRCISDADRREPILLRSTLNEVCPVVMKYPEVRASPVVRPSSAVTADSSCKRWREGSRGARQPSPRATWLHKSGGSWLVAMDDTPGPPQYSPRTPGQTENRGAVAFNKEKRFLCTTTRFITRDHERQALGLFSPGPARYVGIGKIPLLQLPSSAPAGCGKRGRFSNEKLAPTRRVSTSNESRFRVRRLDPGTGFIGIEERGAAEKHLGKARAGSTGVHVMRLPERPQDRSTACFPTRLGTESPGPADHLASVSCISSRGAPVFAAPNALDCDHTDRGKTMKHVRNWRMEWIPAQKPKTTSQTTSRAMPKAAQVLRRWPTFTHFRNGKISGNFGSDSPGPASVNIANHDPFRPMSFLKTEVCHPPPLEKKSVARRNVEVRRS